MTSRVAPWRLERDAEAERAFRYARWFAEWERCLVVRSRPVAAPVVVVRPVAVRPVLPSFGAPVQKCPTVVVGARVVRQSDVCEPCPTVVVGASAGSSGESGPEKVPTVVEADARDLTTACVNIPCSLSLRERAVVVDAYPFMRFTFSPSYGYGHGVDAARRYVDSLVAGVSPAVRVPVTRHPELRQARQVVDTRFGSAPVVSGAISAQLDVLSAVCAGIGVESPRLLSVVCGAGDGGFCFVAMASESHSREVTTLGAYPTLGAILQSPAEWFRFPLAGVVSVVADGVCHIDCTGGTVGLPLDRVLSAAASTRHTWAAGSLGALLLQGHLGRLLGPVVIDVDDPYLDVVRLVSPPDALPDGTLVVCATNQMVPDVLALYPLCTVVGPERISRAPDIVYFAGADPAVSSWVEGIVSDAAYRSLIWVSAVVPPPKRVLRRLVELESLFSASVQLVDLKAGFIRGAALELSSCGESRPIHPGPAPGDTDFLFLCSTEACKRSLLRGSTALSSHVFTMSEAQDRVAADVYVYTPSAAAAAGGSGDLVVCDASNHVRLASVGATRAYYLVDS